MFNKIVNIKLKLKHIIIAIFKKMHQAGFAPASQPWEG